MSAALAATGRRVAMVRVAWHHVGLKVTVRLVRSKGTAIVATGRRVARKVSARRGVSKANAIAAIARHVARKVNVLAANMHRDVLTASARRDAPKANATEPIDRHAVRKVNVLAANAHRGVSTVSAHRVTPKANATEPIDHHAVRKVNVPAANAHRVVSTASAHLARRVKKAHAGRTVQRHAPRIQMSVATARREVNATIHANAPTPLVPASGQTGVRPARDVTPNVLPVAAAPGVPHSRKNATRANAASGRLRNP